MEQLKKVEFRLIDPTGHEIQSMKVNIIQCSGRIAIFNKDTDELKGYLVITDEYCDGNLSISILDKEQEKIFKF